MFESRKGVEAMWYEYHDNMLHSLDLVICYLTGSDQKRGNISQEVNSDNRHQFHDCINLS